MEILASLLLYPDIRLNQQQFAVNNNIYNNLFQRQSNSISNQ